MSFLHFLQLHAKLPDSIYSIQFIFLHSIKWKYFHVIWWTELYVYIKS